MIFRDNDHKESFEKIMQRMKHNSPYHRSAAYLMALANMPADEVFNFTFGCIRHEGLFAPWQTSSSRHATRLMFNLWNGCHQDHASDDPDASSGYYAVDEIFSNREYAPWFYEAVKIRFEMD